MPQITNCRKRRLTPAVKKTRRQHENQAVRGRQLILGRLMKKYQRLARPYALFSWLIPAPCFLKEKDRTGKKVAKTEKEKKDKESQEKARSMMASFFGKPKTSSTATSPSKGPTPSTSSTLPEFERVFRAFTLKKDAELAPVNWLQDAKRRKQYAGAEMIVIDEDDTGDHDVEMSEPEPSSGANTRRNFYFIKLLIIH